MNTRKGFTLIELMIVIAIIAIIAAIAIPNLMASRIRANEATAVSALKQIATAQVTFQAGRQGRNTANTSAAAGVSGYCDNYRNLAFGIPVGSVAPAKLALINDAVANAFLTATGGGASAVAGTAAMGVLATAANYQGYMFEGDPDVLWATDFAAYTVPQLAGTGGNNAYWVGQAGTVYMRGMATSAVASVPFATTTTPQTIPVPAAWTTL